MLWWSRLRFWYPHDDGTLAQGAMRVLEGQLPHRDFVYPYTGADALLHAAMFGLAHPALDVIRSGFALIVMAWLLWLGLWLRARVGAADAALAVLAIGALGPACYPAAMPSWYVVMLVTTGVVMLVPASGRQPTPGALLQAGTCLGIGLAFKVSAVYAIVGVGCWLVLAGREVARPSRVWSVGLVAAAALAALALLMPAMTSRRAIHLLLPPLAAAVVVLVVEVRGWRRHGATLRLTGAAPLGWLAAGICLGIAPVLLWLAAGGALIPFLASVGGVGELRAAFAGMSPPTLPALVLACPVVALWWSLSGPRPPHPVLVAMAAGLVFLLAWGDYEWHRRSWQAVRGAIPLGAVVLVPVLARRGADVTRPWVPVALVLGWMVLSQFPFSAPVYFLYLAPLVIVGLLLITPPTSAGRGSQRVLLTALTAFGFLQVIPSPLSTLGWSRAPAGQLRRLDGVRGGVLVPLQEAEQYEELLTLLADSVPAGPIWSGPDAPEIAFLAGRQELNPAFFGFLQPGGAEGALGDATARALVLRRAPPFSPAPSAEEIRAWQRRMPRSREIGDLTVLWGE
ncbi:MAG: hypothetical protein AB7V35_10340 [Gemmatimonadales bacterium]